MNKDQFLALAGELYEKSNPVEENKVVLDKNLFDEIVDQVSSEIFEEGRDLINDYTLEMYSREVELESVELDLRAIEKTISNVLERYFEIK